MAELVKETQQLRKMLRYQTNKMSCLNAKHRQELERFKHDLGSNPNMEKEITPVRAFANR